MHIAFGSSGRLAFLGNVWYLKSFENNGPALFISRVVKTLRMFTTAFDWGVVALKSATSILGVWGLWPGSSTECGLSGCFTMVSYKRIHAETVPRTGPLNVQNTYWRSGSSVIHDDIHSQVTAENLDQLAAISKASAQMGYLIEGLYTH